MGRAHEVRAKAMAATAAKKSKLYSIYAKEIYQAAKGNPDPTSNDVLRRVIEKAKKEQVPADVINRNIEKVKKGVSENYETVEYEAFAQGGSSLIIKCLTDNSNRTISFVKTVFNKCGAKMASQGSVSFMYEHLGVIGIKDHSEEEVMDALINADVDVNDIENENDMIVVYTEVQDLNNAKKALETAFPGITFELDEISYFSKDSVTLSGEDKEKFEFGSYLHYLLEITDFKKKDLTLIDEKYQPYFLKLFNLDLFNNLDNTNIYKEYEFIYESNNIKKHGIIDLMIEHDNYIDIIDYKLKNIEDNLYHEQLLGYKEYIKTKTNKDINLYLYSIIDGRYEKIE